MDLSFSDILEPYSPQYYGIIAGCIVYVVTVTSVIVLLVKSGTFSRMREQTVVRSGKGTMSRSKVSARPLLYDELLQARDTLPRTPAFEVLYGQRVRLVPLPLPADAAHAESFQKLFEISNGAPCFGYGAYAPLERIWGPLEVGPFTSAQEMMDCDLYANISDSQHFAVTENKTEQVIGAVSFTNNRPRDLGITIDGLWLTPAYQNAKQMLAQEVIYLMARAAFEKNYRRVQCCCDSHNFVARKLFLRIHLTHEGILRKHKIVRDSNSDACVYAYTNSDWYARGTGVSVKKTIEHMLYGRALLDDESMGKGPS